MQTPHLLIALTLAALLGVVGAQDEQEFTISYTEWSVTSPFESFISGYLAPEVRKESAWAEDCDIWLTSSQLNAQVSARLERPVKFSGTPLLGASI